MLKNSKYIYGPQDAHLPAHLNFGRYIIDRLWANEDKVALINAETNEEFTYRSIAQDSMNLAVSLLRLGVKKGDKVALISENREEYFPVLFGVACTGAVLTTLNPLYSKDELSHAFSISLPRFAICSPTAYRKHEATLRTTGHLEKIILLDLEQLDNTILYHDLITPDNTGLKRHEWDRLTEDIRYEEFTVVDVVGQIDVVYISYSSGTTGMSKGVMLTHYNVMMIFCSSIVDFCDGPLMAIGPWFHVMAFFGILLGFPEGRTYVYLPKFEVHAFLKTLEKYKVTLIIAPPAVMIAVSRVDETYDLSSLKRIISGSMPLHPSLVKKFLPKFPNLTGVMMGYGLTETTLAITKNTFDDTKKLNSATVGKVVKHTVTKIVDPDTKKVCGPNEHGEICIKGAMLMKGYVGKVPADVFDDEGFFKTGDIGYYDEEGYFYVVERIKELIKYKGNQVPPAEIEALLGTHEAVAAAGVVGLPDDEAGELPLAFVELRPGMTATEQEIKDFVAQRLSSPKHLRGGVRFIQAMPRTGVGKIWRKALRDIVNEKN